MTLIRKLLAGLSLVTALVGAFSGLSCVGRMRGPACALIFFSGAFNWVAWSLALTRSPSEGLESEVDTLRWGGRILIRQARFASLGMLASVLILRSFLSFDLEGIALMAASVALVLSLHLFPRIYPRFDPPVPEPWVESLPAAETPVPDPEPGMARLLARKESLQARGYR